jgi:hypothetical protein
MPNNSKLLLGLLLVLTTISYLVINNKASLIDETQQLIPELQSHINDIDKIIMDKNDQRISLFKQSGVWRIREVDGFLADTNKVANLLLDLRKLTLKDKKTKNPENFARLSLAESGINAATFIKLYKGDVEITNISIGKEAQKSQGTYVRKNSEDQTWLAEGLFKVKLEAQSWILKTIVDIDNRAIKSIKFSPTNSAGFTLNKLTPQDAGFIIENIPENKKLKAGINLNELANGLKNLTIDFAMKLPEMTNQFITTKVEYQLFSGMIYTLELYNNGEIYQLKISQDNAEAGQIQGKILENWLFEIPEYKYNALHVIVSDYLEDA